MEFKLEDYPKITEDILNKIETNQSSATILALHGNLGAGKTTLTQEVCRQLKIKEMVSSPTFVIEKEYEVDSSLHNFQNLNSIKKLIHIDTYRLESSHDLLNLGLAEELKDFQNLIIIEWPEKVEEILPKSTIHIYIDYLDKDRRSITIKPYGEGEEDRK